MSKVKVAELAKDLEKAKSRFNVSRMIEILDSLDECQVNTTVLRQTQIGKIVNATSKSQPNEEIRRKADALIKKWKSIVTQEKQALKDKKNANPNGKSSSSNTTKSKNKTKNKTKTKSSRSDSMSGNSSNENNGENKNNGENDDENSNSNSDGGGEEDIICESRSELEWESGVKNRDKVRSKLIEALKPSPDYTSYRHYVQVAVDIEKALFNEINQRKGKKEYLNKYRDLNFNIRKNEDLKSNILRQRIKISQLILMSSQDLASNKLKEQRTKTKNWKLAEARSDNKRMETMTDEYKCGKCKSRRIKYSQAQTRSADEPMTTFFACLECGNKWKMG